MVDSSFTEFKLDYPEIKTHGLGDAVSKSVSAGHYSWKIECHHWENDKDDNLALYLSLSSKLNNFNGFFEVFLLRRDGTPSRRRARSSLLQIAPEYIKRLGNYVTWSDQLFVKRGCLERYATNGVITLVCGVIALPGNSIPVPPSNIGEHIGSLQPQLYRFDLLAPHPAPDVWSGEDVSFSVGGETCRAHRAVLAARSPVFKAELFGSMAEAKLRRITLRDIEPATFKTILWFMYTDRLYVQVDPETLTRTAQQYQHVLAAADRYDLGRLKLMCAQQLWDMVSVETVAATLGYAEMHNCPELKSRCLDFFMTGKNFKRIVVTEGYLWLMQRFPSVIDEIKPGLENLICY
jgi:speckle-type POZ protein